HGTSIACSAQLHTGAAIRCLATNQSNSLLLHVRTHPRTVSIVVLQERNHRGTNGDHLTRRNVNEVNTISVSHANIAVLEANLNAVINDVALGVRSEEHTSELQSRFDLVCRLLLEKKKTRNQRTRR